MQDKGTPKKTGTWIVRNIPADLMRRLRMAALAEQTTVRDLLIDLVEGHLKDLEKKGVLPKRRG
jgi:porphobilinogen deaminase